MRSEKRSHKKIKLKKFQAAYKNMLYDAFNH